MLSPAASVSPKYIMYFLRGQMRGMLGFSWTQQSFANLHSRR